MNQTRSFLFLAWAMVAALLWMQWNAEHAPTTPPANAATQALPATTNGLQPPSGTIPAAADATPAQPAQQATTQAAPAIEVRTDVLRLQLNGDGVQVADLLHYPRDETTKSAPVRLLDDTPAQLYAANSSWMSGTGASAKPLAFAPVGIASSASLAPGQQQLVVPFEARTDEGVVVHREYVLSRGSYVVTVRDRVRNEGTAPWQGYVSRQLVRVPPVLKSSMVNPESYSFHGAVWFSQDGGYQRRRFDDKYLNDGNPDKAITGGWLAMLQHHFFVAWIPQKDQPALYALAQNGALDSINASGPQFSLAPGQSAASDARLWIGPKLVSQIKAQNVPGLDRAVDYSRFALFAMLGQGLFWILSHLHALFGNWGWAIIGLVVLLKLVLFPLSNAQYKSAAQMRRFQPRLQQLKERYGDDKQKYQQAMLELYKKEKINPMGGCLPIIPQILIFMTLYWVLSESVELRQAPWIGWIHDLTARDPYFILPVLNAAIMFATQHLMPAAPGMDPTQQKMMKMMPLVFGVVLMFLPAGLVLYQVANGGLGLLQQWYMLRKYGEPPAKKA
ncbi:MAG: membrane protein insertase YidC [Thermomonas sp.]